MATHLDNTLVHPFDADSPFAYGEHTVLQLRAQPFQVEDELGTVLTMPIDTNVRLPRPAEEDGLARLEAKLDLALRQLEKLQQRVESLDLTLARALSR